jgi:hypothetical protein
MRFSTELRNARANQLETVAGTAPRLHFYSGSAPANLSDAATGTLLAEAVLPSDWLTDAVNGVKSKSGTWNDPAADASGTVGYARLYKSDGTTTVAQFTVGTSGADINLLTLALVEGMPINIETFTFTDGNA